MERKNRERALWQIFMTVCLVTSFFFTMGHAALAATCPSLRYGPATNGAAMAAIPIMIPPHRPGLVPSLDLTYNSLRPAGWLGRGWDLELGSIKKISNTFYYAVGNTLEALVKVRTENLGNGWYNDYYALKFERQRGLLKMHYRSQCGTDNSCSIMYSEWSATLDGLSYTFGTFDTSNSDNIIAYTSYANVDQPLQEQWSLRSVSDRYGNYTSIAYEKVWSDEVIFWVSYPTLISYNDDLNRIGFERDSGTQTLSNIRISSTYGQSYFYTLQYESSADTTISRLTDVTYTKGSQSSPSVSLTWTGCSGISGSCDFLKTVDNGQGGITTFEYTSVSNYPVLHKVTNDNGFGSTPFESFGYSGASTSNNSLVFGTVTATRSDGTVTTTRNNTSGDKFGLPSSVEQTGPIPLKTTYGWGVNSGFIRINEVRTEHKNSGGSTVGSTKNTYAYDATNFFNLASVTSDGVSRNRIIVSYDGWTNSLSSLTNVEWWRPTGEKVKEVVNGVETLRSAKTWHYNSRGYPEAVVVQTDTSGTQATTSIGYDNKGNPSQITDPQGNITTIGYDSTLHLWPAKVTMSTVNNIQLTASVAYDYTFGKPSSTTDTNGKTTSYTYDYAGRPNRVANPDGTGLVYLYRNYYNAAYPQYTRTWRYGGGIYETLPLAIQYFDGFGREIQTVTPVSDTSRSKTTTRYDATGNVSIVWGPYASSDWNYNASPTGSIPKQTLTYNSKGQLQSVAQALSGTANATTTFGYDGFTRTVTDPDGRKTTAIADDLGRVIKVTDAMNNASAYVYDALNNLLGITATPSGKAAYQVVTSAYDLRGLTTSVTRPGEGTRNLTYDLNGNLLSEIVPGDNSITKVYDALGRVSNTTESKSGKRTLYSKFYYDACDGATNVKGRLCKATRDGITNEFPSYDAMGRVLTEKKTIGTMGYATAFSYDAYGRLASITHPDATRIVYSYVTGTDLANKVTTGAGQTIADVSYTAGDLVSRVTYGNGTHVDSAYDPISLRLSSKKSFNAAGGLLQGWSYQFSNAGDMISKTDLKTNAAAVYTYDALHRITLETANSATVSNFLYEPYGNLSYKFEPNPNGGLQGRTYTYDPTYRYKLQNTVLGSTATYGYDINGNTTSLVSQPSENYSYGVNGLLELSWNPSILTSCYKNSYDAFGARSAKNGPFACNTSSGPSQRNYVSPDYEATSNNATREVYVTLGGEKIAKIGNGSAITWLHHDHLGSTTMTTNSAGTPTDTADYDLFGQLRSGRISATNYLYTGQEYDPENGLYYYKSRYYDPSLGRFASPDSIIPGIYDSQAFASYNYVGNNPLTYTDPDGHVRETEIFNTLAWLFTLAWDHPARLSMECLYWMFRIEHALDNAMSDNDPNRANATWAVTRKKYTMACRELLHLDEKTSISGDNYVQKLSLETLATARAMMQDGCGINPRELNAVGGVPGILAAIRKDTYRGMQLMINLLHEQIQGATTTTTTTTTAANTVLYTLPPFAQQFGVFAQLPIPQNQFAAQPQPQPQPQFQISPQFDMLVAFLLYSMNLPHNSQ